MSNDILKQNEQLSEDTTMTENTCNQAESLLNCALKKLDEWRHLPAYQLERRVDIFFGLLLPEILQEKFKLDPSHMTVIPEFPLHKVLFVNDDDKNGEGHRSVNVDYAAFHRGADGNRIFLVELKTDNASISVKQLDRMEKAQCRGACEVLKGVICCARHSRSPHKYAHLIRRLNELGCLEPFEDFSESWKLTRPGLADRFRKLKVGENWCNAKIECVLLYPGTREEVPFRSAKVKKKMNGLKNPSSRVQLVDFLEIEKWGLVKDTKYSPLARFLVKWAHCEAGKANPWQLKIDNHCGMDSTASDITDDPIQSHSTDADTR